MPDIPLELDLSGTTWFRVDSLETAGPRDHVFVAEEREDGTVALRFGDGDQGARPPAGNHDLVARFATGAGHWGRVQVQEGRVVLDPDWHELDELRSLPGIYRAVVTNVDDPTGRSRVEVRVGDADRSLWAEACLQPGVLARPHVGSTVWVAFEGGASERPVWLGTLPTP